MNYKRLFVLFSSIIFAFVLSACGYNAIPELTEEDEAKVVTYMADLLLSRYPGYSDDLLDASEKELAEAEEIKKQEELERQLAYEKEKAEKEQADRENRDIEKHEAETVDITYGMEDISKCANVPEGLSVEFTHITETLYYPEEGNDFFSPITASDENNKLIAVGFNIVNNTDDIIEYNSLDIGSKYRIVVNGDKYSCITHLYGDLNLYIDDIEPHSANEVVLISEIPKDISVENVGLYIINSNNETFNIGLQ